MQKEIYKPTTHYMRVVDCWTTSQLVNSHDIFMYTSTEMAASEIFLLICFLNNQVKARPNINLHFLPIPLQYILVLSSACGVTGVVHFI